MPARALAPVFPVPTFRVLLNGWKIRLDYKVTATYIICSYYFISNNALFCDTLNVHFLCSYRLSLFVFYMILCFFVWYIYALFLFHTIFHLSFLLSSPCIERGFLLSFFLVINCIYCLFSFLLCALFLPLACLSLLSPVRDIVCA